MRVEENDSFGQDAWKERKKKSGRVKMEGTCHNDEYPRKSDRMCSSGGGFSSNKIHNFLHVCTKTGFRFLFVRGCNEAGAFCKVRRRHEGKLCSATTMEKLLITVGSTACLASRRRGQGLSKLLIIPVFFGPGQCWRLLL